MVDYLGGDGAGYGVAAENTGDAAPTDTGAGDGSGQAAAASAYEYKIDSGPAAGASTGAAKAGGKVGAQPDNLWQSIL